MAGLARSQREGPALSLDACPGVLALHPARDGLVARFRLPGGYATRPRWRALASLARQFGDGCLDLTARGNVQVRGLREQDAAALAARAARLGLLPSAEHDRARNITASPLAGLGGRPPLRRLVTTLDDALLADPALATLPGRFLIAADDGTGGAGLASCDLGLRARPSPAAPPGSEAAGPGDDPARYAPPPRLAAAFDLIVAGRETGLTVPAVHGAAVILAAARDALAQGVGATVTRIAALPDGGQAVAAARGGILGDQIPADTRLPLGLVVPGVPPLSPPPPDGPLRDYGALAVAAPLGRLTVAQARLILSLLRPRETMRIGIAGRLVIPLAVPPDAALRALRAAAIPCTAADPLAGVTACSGAACARSLADVRPAARPVPGYPATHWAGCSRLCGCPPDAEPVVALNATRYRAGDKVLT
jgi:precorrin-3B synthase